MDFLTSRRISEKEEDEARPAGKSVSISSASAEFGKVDGYSVVLPEKLADGRWNVYRSSYSPLQLVDSIPDHPEIRTMHDNLEYAISVYGDMPFLGTRVRPDGSVKNFEWFSYKEAGMKRTAVGASLYNLGFTKGARIGFYFINRAEWVILEHACYSYGLVSVPLYDTLGYDAVKYIINHAEISVVVCTKDKLKILKDCLPECPSLKLLVVLGVNEQDFDFISLRSSLQHKLDVMTYAKLEAQGKFNPPPFCPMEPQEMCSICYTSGTTGVPKGAMLTHANMRANIGGVSLRKQLLVGDSYLSYLPLAHIYERMNVNSLITNGAAIGFYQGDVLKLMEDLEELRPTLFASVPRLYNRIYDRTLSTIKASGGMKEYLFNMAYRAKKHALEKGVSPSPIWDRLVFNKVKARLGGRVRLMITGASPISAAVVDFLRICFSATVIEGYGMTETTSAISFMDVEDRTSGHVGSPNPACEVKLEDVAEMKYNTSDKPFPRGEVCVRGPVLIPGYFKDEKQTAELFDSDGWLHTGDIGMWLPGGRLKIIDRKKNIFKLAQGEYIAPEKIENVYLRSQFVAQCFIYGDSFNSSLVAVVAPDADVLLPWAKSRGLENSDDLAQLVSNPVVRSTILDDMDKVALEAKLRGFELAKAIHLVSEPLSLENGLLTPTFKIKRAEAKAYFEKEIEEMYAELAKKDSLYSDIKARL